MKYLLDTNALIFGITAFDTLGATYRDILTNPENTLVISPASIWEMAIKVRLGKLDLPGTSLANVAVVLRRKFKIGLLPIRQQHLLAIVQLPKVKGHGDPFDLLIIAQALYEDLPVLTSDAEFYRYGVNVVR